MPPTRDPPPLNPRENTHDGGEAHWHANLRLTAVLLAAWFAVSFVVVFFARDLSVSRLGWPVSFWMAAQGAPLIYGLIVSVYAGQMRRQDRLLAASEGD